ncbi:PREDICTED: polyadenylate-binding protein 1-A-like [Wasmannia auropunctata]|uniref:polyadenylate-binding protein 1-A-like n=1 Tax=Wasmannia auropunctata TaxID=64793 RepID=UPI0005EE208B|nr:PREDICTED: polyadenylate-binding protein 1-A-like [Wasmannia auropunctata]
MYSAPQNSQLNILDPTYLFTLSRQKQRKIIGQHLYPLIFNMYPNFFPHKLTDILLDINSIGALISMIHDPVILKTKLGEAVRVLQTYYGLNQ